MAFNPAFPSLGQDMAIPCFKLSATLAQIGGQGLNSVTRFVREAIMLYCQTRQMVLLEEIVFSFPSVTKHPSQRPTYSPGFGVPKMQVVDTVEIHVLGVPCKGGLPHSKIKVWSIHTFDDDSTLMLHHVQEGVQIPNIPLVHILQ